MNICVCLSATLLLLGNSMTATANPQRLNISRPKASMAMPIPAAPKLNSKAYILVDANSNKILAAHNADERVEPASLTKLMTAYLASKAIQAGTLTPDQKLHISKKAWRMPGSRMFVEVGSDVPVSELLKGVIIQSGNDASIALAEAIAGSEEAFANLMNAQAKQLGMNNTHFMNASGLPHKEHYSSAHDIAILSQAVIRDFPGHYDIYSQKWYSYNNIKQPNRNRLLWSDKSVDGLKTGHTDSAGFCLAASAKRDDMRLISVLIGADNDAQRARESRQLIAYGFQYYETHTLYSANETLKNERVWMGTNEQLPIGLANNLVVTVPKGSYKELTANLHLNKEIKAPVKQGEQIGTLVVSLNGEAIIERPLLALNDVEEGSMWTKFKDYVSLTVHGWLNSEKTEPQGDKA